MTQHTSYKKYKLLLPVLLLACLCSCRKNFLDVEPQGTYTTDTYPYPGGSGPYDTYLFAAYAEMRSFNTHSQSFICATLMRSDDADKGSTPSDGGADASRKGFSKRRPVNVTLNWLAIVPSLLGMRVLYRWSGGPVDRDSAGSGVGEFP